MIMKKQTAITVALLIALGGLAACSASRDIKSENESTVRVNDVAVGENTENSTQSVSSVTFIGEEKTKELIANHVGIAVASINFNKIELDEDDNVWKYEAEFTHNGITYDAEINAANGEIIKWEEKMIAK